MKTFLQFLAEADPKPQVWKDINGLPVEPKEKDFSDYFGAMQKEHVKDQMNTLKQRFSDAADSLEATKKAAEQNRSDAEKMLAVKHAEAVLKAIKTEEKVGKKVLDTK